MDDNFPIILFCLLKHGFQPTKASDKKIWRVQTQNRIIWIENRPWRWSVMATDNLRTNFTCAQWCAGHITSSTSQQLSIPRTKLNLGKRAFSVAAPIIWNELPTTLKSCESLVSFHKNSKNLYPCMSPALGLINDLVLLRFWARAPRGFKRYRSYILNYYYKVARNMTVVLDTTLFIVILTIRCTVIGVRLHRHYDRRIYCIRSNCTCYHVQCCMVIQPYSTAIINSELTWNYG